MKSETFWAYFEAEARPRLGFRADTFAAMFEYLDTFDRPVTIIETGCVRKTDNWEGDGQSTILFDQYAKHHTGSRVHAVDIDPEATRLCQTMVSQRVKIRTVDSIRYLRSLALNQPHRRPLVDLLYLDSFDFDKTDPIPSCRHHLNELYAAMPLIRPDTLVVVDDSPLSYDGTSTSGLAIGGKGRFVADYALQVGADLKFTGYQIGWTRMERHNNGEPIDIKSLVERAREHVESGRGLSADNLYRLILQQTTPPIGGVSRVAHAEACVFFARESIRKQKFGTAADWYRQACNADPLATDYRLELIVKALIPMGALKEAQIEAYRATRIAPDYPTAWHTLGGVEHEMGDIEACIAAYDKQLELVPDDPNAMLDRATIALDTEDYDLGRELVEKVLQTDRAADATHCLAMIAYRERRYEEAIALYDKALEMGCRDQPMTRWNKSLAMHSIGRLRDGWVEHEERKRVTAQPAMSLPARRFVLPMWNGEPAPARIHVHHEAGMGDNLCLVRYLNLLVRRGYDVRYETHDQMVDLMARSFPEVNVMRRAIDYPAAFGIPVFDFHAPVGSLPAMFATDIDTIPWDGPYIKASRELSEEYRKRMPRRSIGLCWSAGIRDGIWISKYGKRKSMHLADMQPIMDALPDYSFVSLQVGPERAELADCPQVLDLLPEKPTWDDTAAVVENLDLVITVDTAISHLAGAMGKDVRLAFHMQGSWHYMADIEGAPWQTSSPWYPNTSIYRQKQEDVWDDVIARIVRDLSAKYQAIAA